MVTQKIIYRGTFPHSDCNSIVYWNPPVGKFEFHEIVTKGDVQYKTYTKLDAKWVLSAILHQENLMDSHPSYWAEINKWSDQRELCKNIPTTKCFIDGNQYVFWCEFCHRWHRHGALTGDRSAHCLRDYAGFSHYWVEPYNKNELELIKCGIEQMVA
jgi:hypothetical protein